MKSIKGFAITPPLLGAIRIGKTVSRGDRRLPQKDDAFTITTQVQNKEGWIHHPLHDVLIKDLAPATEGARAKLRAIPIKLMFDNPDLNLRAEYSAFDGKTGRPLCAGDGEKARRRTSNGVECVECPGSDNCQYGREQRCKLYGRLNVQIEGQNDELGTFVFRTTGFNSVRTLSARLSYLHALTGGKLAGLPLTLRLRAKTSSNSFKSVVYYVDIQVREGMSLAEAFNEGKANRASWDDIGLSRSALERVAQDGFNRSAFEDTDEDACEVIEEFFNPETANQDRHIAHGEWIDGDGVVHGGGAPAGFDRYQDDSPLPPARNRAAGGLASLRQAIGQDGLPPALAFASADFLNEWPV